MEPISDVISRKKLEATDKPKRVQFQIRALEVAEKLGIKLEGKDSGSWFRLFKTAEKNKKVDVGIGKAVSYLSDYPGQLTNQQRIKYFYWLVFHK